MRSRLPGPVEKFVRLDAGRKRLLLEASATLTAISALLRLLPFRRAIELGAVPLGQCSDDQVAADCVWAVERAGRALPWRIVCIQQGIAAQRMLRRHGFDARLHYGVAKGREVGELAAHVWVSVNGSVLIGGAEAPKFTAVAAYP